MLQLSLDEFSWQRPASRKKGFAWEGTGEHMQLVHVPGAAFSSFRPDAAIFREFAGLEQSPDAVLNFANRYGALRQRLEFNPFSFWRTGIQQMSQLVTFSDAVTAGDWKRIPKAIQTFLADPNLANAGDIRPIRQKQKQGELVSRNELAHAAVVRLCHAIMPFERLEVEGSWNSLSGRVVLRLKHEDLLGFMFCQLGHAFIGGSCFFYWARAAWVTSLFPPGDSSGPAPSSGFCRVPSP